jgi:predicted PurR-regulated permease PerM
VTKNKKIGLVVLALIACGFLFYLLFRPLIIPLALAGMLALVLNPVVDWMESRRVPRLVGAFLCLIFSGLFVVALVGGFIPSAVEQVSHIASKAPDAFTAIYGSITEKLNATLKNYGFSSREVSTLAGNKAQILGNILGRLESGFAGVLATSTRLLSGLIDAALIPFFAFFLLIERERVNQWFIGLLPTDVAPVFVGVLSSTGSALRAVLQGQFFLILVDSLLYTGLMLALGIDGGAVLGLAAGLCRIVPYLDAIVSISLGGLAIVSHEGTLSQFLALSIGVLGVQAIDGFILTPRLVGGRAGLHPAVVIGTVLAFGKLMGVWGIVFAIPLAATAKTLSAELMPYYRQSLIYSGSSGLASAGSGWFNPAARLGSIGSGSRFLRRRSWRRMRR